MAVVKFHHSISVKCSRYRDAGPTNPFLLLTSTNALCIVHPEPQKLNIFLLNECNNLYTFIFHYLKYSDDKSKTLIVTLLVALFLMQVKVGVLYRLNSNL